MLRGRTESLGLPFPNLKPHGHCRAWNHHWPKRKQEERAVGGWDTESALWGLETSAAQARLRITEATKVCALEPALTKPSVLSDLRPRVTVNGDFGLSQKFHKPDS